MKKIAICLILFAIFLNIHIKSFAMQNENKIYIDVTNTEIKKGEEFSLTINIGNANISAFDFQIYFNDELLELVSGPENTNVVGNRIITVWYDETGKENEKYNCELVKYTFRAKEIGNEYIAIQGKIYNSEGIELEDFTDGIVIVANKEINTEIIETTEQSQVSSSNSKLKILRLNHEGITPVFSPDITEYYFLTEDLTSLDVMAIPENIYSNVNITGNTDMKDGLNTIAIEVTSQDKTSKTIYQIFVTKTKELEKANAKLETLAIENVILEPEFSNDIYQYDANVSNITETLKILAIPENQNADVKIEGIENLQYGNNKVAIQIIAENGYTTKQYIINVYRRNEEEQKIADDEAKINLQKLNAILELQEDSGGEKEKNQKKYSGIEYVKKNFWFIIMYLIFSILIIILVMIKINMKL